VADTSEHQGRPAVPRRRGSGPGPDLATEAAAALAGWPASRARAVLGRLARAHLVEAASGPARWRMHDLRLYARQVPGTSDGERDEAIGRLLDWYSRHADAADDHPQALAGESVPGSSAAAVMPRRGWMPSGRTRSPQWLWQPLPAGTGKPCACLSP
jgi:hypothetical protein